VPSDGERPDELRVPFIFVPHGHPEPKEWMERYPGWVKFPAVMVPRAEPDRAPFLAAKMGARPQPTWPPAAMPASLPMQGPFAEVAAVPQPPPAPEPLIEGMTAEATERYAARNHDPIQVYLAMTRYIESVIGPGPRPAMQPATALDAVVRPVATSNTVASSPRTPDGTKSSAPARAGAIQLTGVAEGQEKSPGVPLELPDGSRIVDQDSEYSPNGYLMSPTKDLSPVANADAKPA
jgi:hypothetical protein